MKKELGAVLAVGLFWIVDGLNSLAAMSSVLHVTCTIHAFTDDDDDGMEDRWEARNGFDPTVADGYWDDDGDGLLNYQEYCIGTNPRQGDTDFDGSSDAEEVFGSRVLDGGVFHNVAVRNGDWVQVKDFYPSDHVDVTFSNAIEVAANNGCGLLLTDAGEVWEWSYDTSSPYAAQPIKRPPFRIEGLSDVVAVTAGDAHNVAVKSDGTVWVWGSCSFGVDGCGASVYRASPIRMVGLSNITAVAAGYAFTAALCRDGTIWTWGNNQWGQLGWGSADSQAHPIPQRIQGLSDITAIATKYNHILAMDRSGRAWAWGYNEYGKLGLGLDDGKIYNTPRPLSGPKRLKSMVCGVDSTLALGWDGRVWGWGANYFSQLGLGLEKHRQTQTSPQLILDGQSVRQIGAGYYHGIAALRNGNVFAWGVMDNPALGRYGLSLVPKQLTSWTVYPFTSDPLRPDTDGDLIPDGMELALGLNPLTPTAGAGDSDQDGLMDCAERYYGTDINDSDSDDDGLSDGDEILVYGTDPNTADTDGDGVADGLDDDPILAKPWYRLEILPTLGGDSCCAYAVNEQGAVAGSSTTPEGATRAFIYHPDFDPPMRNLGALRGSASMAYDLNDFNDVVGESGGPFLYRFAEGTLTDLGASIPSVYGSGLRASGINNAGQIALSSTKKVYVGIDPVLGIKKYKYYDYALLYNEGVITCINPAGNVNSYAACINENGVVGGSSSSRAIFYDPANPPTVIHPSILWADDLNASGEALGWNSGHVYLYDSNDQMMTDVGSLGSTIYGRRMNDHAQAVGSCKAAKYNNAQHAFLYDPDGTEIKDLNEHLHPEDVTLLNGGFLTYAHDINNHGVIVGITSDGRGYKLTPAQSAP